MLGSLGWGDLSHTCSVLVKGWPRAGTSFLPVLALYFCYCWAKKTKVSEEASGPHLQARPSGAVPGGWGGDGGKLELCSMPSAHRHKDIRRHRTGFIFHKGVLLYMHACFTTYFLTLTVGVGHLSILHVLV